MPNPTNDNKPQTVQRRRNAAAAPSDDAERHAEDHRSFATDAPPGGHMGSGGDPSEGKRTD